MNLKDENHSSDPVKLRKTLLWRDTRLHWDTAAGIVFTDGKRFDVAGTVSTGTQPESGADVP